MSFCHVPCADASGFTDALTKSQLQKWDMLKGMRLHVFRYTKYYHRMAVAELALDLLNDAAVQGVLKVMCKGGGWSPLPGRVVSVSLNPVPCTLTRMDIFDKLSGPNTQPPMVRPVTGELVRRMEDNREGFQVTDNLREMLLCEESENAELYSPDERQELLWRVFEHICLGGPCCQFEDKLEVYTEAAKRIYKELVMVQKNASTGAIEVASTAYRITGLTIESGDSFQLFPAHNRNCFLYLLMDPVKRLAKLWYHAFVPFW